MTLESGMETDFPFPVVLVQFSQLGFGFHGFSIWILEPEKELFIYNTSTSRVSPFPSKLLMIQDSKIWFLMELKQPQVGQASAGPFCLALALSWGSLPAL